MTGLYDDLAYRYLEQIQAWAREGQFWTSFSGGDGGAVFVTAGPDDQPAIRPFALDFSTGRGLRQK